MKSILPLASACFVLFSSFSAFSQENAPPSYARTGRDSTILVTGDEWILEEYDHLSRPSSALTWVNNAITVETSWVYEGNSSIPTFRIDTKETETIEQKWDSAGNPVSRESKDAEGSILERESWTWDEQNRLTSYEKSAGAVVTRKEIRYSDEPYLKTVDFFRNSAIQSRSVYTDEDDWTETIYRNGLEILTIEWVDGIRTGMVSR